MTLAPRLLRSSFALLLSCAAAFGQHVGHRTGSMLPFLSTDARAAALADATSSLTGGLAGLEANPATLAFLGRPAARLSYHHVTSDLSLQSAALAFPVGTGAGAGIDATLVHPGRLSFFSDPALRSIGFEFAGGISGALVVADDLAAGAAVRFYHSTTDVDPVWAAAANLGLVYTPGRTFRFGLALRGVGSDFDAQKPVFPPDEPASRIPRVFGLSTIFTYPLGAGGENLLLAFENEKILAEPGILYKIGAELRPWAPLALRGALQARQEEIEPRAGAGITAWALTIDYAYRYNRRDGTGHLVTLSAGWE